MSAIAQRRTAAAAAIMMLFAVLQFVLFSVNPTPAGAAHVAPVYYDSNVNCSVVSDGTEVLRIEPGADAVEDVTIGSETFTVTVEVDEADNTFDWSTSDGLLVQAVFVKGGSGGGGNMYDYQSLGGETSDSGLHAPENPSGSYAGLSHITFCVDTETPTAPGLATATVTALCDDKDDFVAVVSNVSNATVSIDLNDDGDFDDAGESGLTDGTHLVTAGVGNSVWWEATATGNNEFDNGETTISTWFEVDDCDDTPPPAGDATATVTALCDDKDDFVAVVSNVSNATVSIDLNDDGDFDDAGESGLTDGTHLVTAGVGNSVWWEATATGNNEFDNGETTISTWFEVDDCDDTPPPPGEVTVSVDGVCDYDEVATFTYTVTASTGVTVDFDGGDQNVTNGGKYESLSASASWVATALDDSVFTGESDGTEEVEDCTPGDDDGGDNGDDTPSRSSRSNDVDSALGDFVWFDQNRNGRQDGGDFEFPVAGATVELLAPDGAVLETQVTGDDGLYLFDDLDAGNYRVRVCLTGAEFTDNNKLGVLDDVDSDVFESDASDGCGTTALITLGEGVTDLTWDAGIVLEVFGIQIEPTTTTAPTTTTIEPVTVETLPFTGLELEDMVVLSIGVLAAGSALLLVAGRRNDESESETVVSGWSNN